MAKKIGPRQREALIRDIFTAEHDVVALAEAHGLSPDALAAWSSMSENQQCLRGLCMVADVQTQLLLSRYRLLAATRLIRLATHEEASASPDVSRKACVDLLRLDLKRVDQAGAQAALAEENEDPAALRDLLYGSNEQDDDTKPAT